MGMPFSGRQYPTHQTTQWQVAQAGPKSSPFSYICFLTISWVTTRCWSYTKLTKVTIPASNGFLTCSREDKPPGEQTNEIICGICDKGYKGNSWFNEEWVSYKVTLEWKASGKVFSLLFEVTSSWSYHFIFQLKKSPLPPLPPPSLTLEVKPIHIKRGSTERIKARRWESLVTIRTSISFM